VEAYLRPERVAVAREGGDAPAGGTMPADAAERFAGVVETVAYHGADASYHVRLDGGGRVVARRPIPGGAPQLAPGDRVVASWDPAHLTIVKAAPSR
jgi:hypothetical protein